MQPSRNDVRRAEIFVFDRADQIIGLRFGSLGNGASGDALPCRIRAGMRRIGVVWSATLSSRSSLCAFYGSLRSRAAFQKRSVTRGSSAIQTVGKGASNVIGRDANSATSIPVYGTFCSAPYNCAVCGKANAI